MQAVRAFVTLLIVEMKIRTAINTFSTTSSPNHAKTAMNSPIILPLVGSQPAQNILQSRRYDLPSRAPTRSCAIQRTLQNPRIDLIPQPLTHRHWGFAQKASCWKSNLGRQST
jgi:hypothetical protein